MNLEAKELIEELAAQAVEIAEWRKSDKADLLEEAAKYVENYFESAVMRTIAANIGTRLRAMSAQGREGSK